MYYSKGAIIMKRSFFKSFSLWVWPGLVAGLVFLAVALISGALTTTVWALPDGIARTLGMDAPAGYAFAPVPVLSGIVVHLAFSIGLGALLAAFVLWRRLHGWMVVVAAVLLVTVETPVALWIVLHNVLPAAAFQYFLSAVPLWGSLLGHYLYALVLGLLLARHPSVAVKKAR